MPQMIFDERVYWNNIARVLSIYYSSPYLGNLADYSSHRKRKEKRLKNKDSIFLVATHVSGTDL
jgi:hypothetical protein